MKDGIQLYVFYTKNTSLTSYFGPPNMTSGFNFHEKDLNGYITTSIVQLVKTNNNTIENSNAYNLTSTSTKSTHFAYLGSGSNGSVVVI